MSELIKREMNDNDTVVCLIERDRTFIVSINRVYDGYEREFDYLFEAYDFFDWALENE